MTTISFHGNQLWFHWCVPKALCKITRIWKNRGNCTNEIRHFFWLHRKPPPSSIVKVLVLFQFLKSVWFHTFSSYGNNLQGSSVSKIVKLLLNNPPISRNSLSSFPVIHWMAAVKEAPCPTNKSGPSLCRATASATTVSIRVIADSIVSPWKEKDHTDLNDYANSADYPDISGTFHRSTDLLKYPALVLLAYLYKISTGRASSLLIPSAVSRARFAVLE